MTNCIFIQKCNAIIRKYNCHMLENLLFRAIKSNSTLFFDLLIDYYYCGRSKDLNELIKMRKLSRILGVFYIPLFLFPYLIVQNNAYKKTRSAMEMREIIDRNILSKILKKINL